MSNSYFSDIGGDFRGFYGENRGTVNQYIIVRKTQAEIHSQRLIKGSPYLGLNKFEPDDKDKFFGREEWITKLSKNLEQDNLLLLLGASGSGKSSLVQAGVIPYLSDEWGAAKSVKLIFAPYINPFESLSHSLPNKYKKKATGIINEKSNDILIKLINDLKESSQNWLIFIDQFEEIFVRTPKLERDKFIGSLVSLIRQQNNSVKLIIAMRSDFIDSLREYGNFINEAESQIRLIRDMTETELRLAIAEPAARNGVTFDQGLINQIISDFNQQAGSLPLLQYTLDLLWEENRISDGNRVLKIKTYNDLGGVAGALQKQADYIYKEKLNDEEKKAAEKIFLELIDLAVKEPVSRRVKQSQFKNDFVIERTVNKLTEYRLLVSGRNDDEVELTDNKTIEVAHEELLRSWRFIQDLILEKEEILILRNRLIADAYTWYELRKQNEKKAKDELWSGSKLERVLELLDEKAFGSLDEKSEQFIQTSVDRRDHLTRELEERRQRELKQARRIAIGAIGAGIMMSALMLLFWFQLRATKISQANTLIEAGSKDLLLNRDFDALLNLLEANKYLKEAVFSNSESEKLAFNELARAMDRVKERNRLHRPAFSSDGRYYAGIFEKKVSIWDTENQIEHTIKHKNIVEKIAFVPNKNLIITQANKEIFVSDLTGKLRLEVKNNLQFIDYSPDGRFLVLCNKLSRPECESIILLDLERAISESGLKSSINISYSNWYTNNWYTKQKELKNQGIFLIHCSDCRKEENLTDKNPIFKVNFSKNTDYLAIEETSSGVVHLLNLSNGDFPLNKNNLKTVDKNLLSNTILSPNGDFLIGFDKNINSKQKLKLWKIQWNHNSIELDDRTNILKDIFLIGLEDFYLSPNGRYLALSDFRDLYLVDLQRNTIRELKGNENTACRYSKYGKYDDNEGKILTGIQFTKFWFISNSQIAVECGHKLNLWNIENNDKFTSIAFGEPEWLDQADLLPTESFVDISPQGNYFIAGWGKNYYSYDLKGKKLGEFNHPDTVAALRFSHKGNKLITATATDLYLWDFEGNMKNKDSHSADVYRITQKIDLGSVPFTQITGVNKFYDNNIKELSAGDIGGLSFSPKDKYILTQKNEIINIFDYSNFINKFDIPIDPDWYWYLSPDHKYLAIDNSSQGKVYLWDLLENEKLTIELEDSSSIRDIIFSKNNKYIAIQQENKLSVNIIGTKQLKLFPRKTLIKNSRYSLTKFSPNGKYLVLYVENDKGESHPQEINQNDLIYLWNLDSNQPDDISSIFGFQAKFSSDSKNITTITYKSFCVDYTNGTEYLCSSEKDVSGRVKRIELKVHLWDLEGSELSNFELIDYENAPDSSLFLGSKILASYGKCMVTEVYEDQKVKNLQLWNLENSKELVDHISFDEGSGNFESAINGDYFAVSFLKKIKPEDYTVEIKIWNLKKCKIEDEIEGNFQANAELSFSQNSKYFIAEGDNIFHLWNLDPSNKEKIENKVIKFNIKEKIPKNVLIIGTINDIGFNFSVNEDFIAITNNNKTLLIKPNGELIKKIQYDGQVNFSPDSEYLSVLNDKKNSLFLYNIKTNKSFEIDFKDQKFYGFTSSGKSIITSTASGINISPLENPEQLVIKACKHVNGYLGTSILANQDIKSFCDEL